MNAAGFECVELNVGEASQVLYGSSAVHSQFNDNVGFGASAAAADATLETVNVGVELAQRTGCESVVAVGDDDTIDLGKLVAVVAENGAGETGDYVKGARSLCKQGLGVFAVPVAPGRGAAFSPTISLPWATEEETVHFSPPASAPELFLPNATFVDVRVAAPGAGGIGARETLHGGACAFALLMDGLLLGGFVDEVDEAQSKEVGGGGARSAREAAKALATGPLLRLLGDDGEGGRGKAPWRTLPPQSLANEWEHVMRGSAAVPVAQEGRGGASARRGPVSTVADLLRGGISLPHASLCAALFPEVMAGFLELAAEGDLGDAVSRALFTDTELSARDSECKRDVLKAVQGLSHDGGDRKSVLCVESLGGARELAGRVDKATVETVIAGADRNRAATLERFVGYDTRARRIKTKEVEGMFEAYERL